MKFGYIYLLSDSNKKKTLRYNPHFSANPEIHTFGI